MKALRGLHLHFEPTSGIAGIGLYLDSGIFAHTSPADSTRPTHIRISGFHTGVYSGYQPSLIVEAQ